MSQIADGKVLYMRNPKEFARKFLELISTFSKVAGYKTNTQKSITFLYINNDHAEKEIIETFPLANASVKQIKTKPKYVGINLTKEVKG